MYQLFKYSEQFWIMRNENYQILEVIQKKFLKLYGKQYLVNLGHSVFVWN